MIAARQIFLGHGGGAKLPYDAEVEYLESTGDQFINTGTKALDVTGFDMTFTPLASLAPAYQGYLSTPSNTDFVIGRTGNTAGTGMCYFRFAANKTLFINTDVLSFVNPNRMYIDQNRKWIVNGTDYGTVNADVLGTVDKDMIFGGIRSGYSRNGAIRLYCVKLYGANGALLRDMIPVRFTNEIGQSEGAMYDRVSKRLLRNAGTGAFLFGADKKDSPPLAYNSYIKDGLVAMWDDEHDNDVSMADKLAPYISQVLSAREARAFSVSVAGDVAFPSVAPFNTSDGTGNFGRVANVNTGTLLIYCGNSQGSQLSIGAAPKSVSLVVNGGVWTCYANDSGGSLVSVSRTAVPETTTGWRPSNIRTSNQTYKNIRIYNRALTAEEIAANYAVDKARFNLP